MGRISAQNHLVAEIEADPAFAGPADEGVDPAALGKFDQHRLAEPGRDRAFDHGSASRDVEHRHRMALASEMDDCGVDQVFVARFAAAIFEAQLLMLDAHRTLPRTWSTMTQK